MTNPDKWYRENVSEKYDDRPVRSEDEISFDDLDELDCVHVIRCKDCVWKDHPGCAILIHGEEDKPSDMDYCSFAEKE